MTEIKTSTNVMISCQNSGRAFQLSLHTNDLNADRKMVPLTFENASSYLFEFVVSFDQKITEHYNDLFLLYLRSCETDNFTFCLVLGKAEMRKRIRYIADVSTKEWKRIRNPMQVRCR